jgi:hypothetical protein
MSDFQLQWELTDSGHFESWSLMDRHGYTYGSITRILPPDADYDPDNPAAEDPDDGAALWIASPEHSLDVQVPHRTRHAAMRAVMEFYERNPLLPHVVRLREEMEATPLLEAEFDNATTWPAPQPTETPDEVHD